MINGESSNGAAPAAGHAIPSLDWRFSQVFGERMSGEEIQEVDIISAIEFDKSGEHLATGDRGGRVVLFDRADDREIRGSRKELEKMDHAIARHPEYRYSTEFQSHEPEFDYLKSLEIEEKINKIRWCNSTLGAHFVLSTNDKTIKLWKVSEKKLKRVTKLNLAPPETPGPRRLNWSQTALQDLDIPPGGFPSLHLPKVSCIETGPSARCRRTYANAHAYHINSISTNSDCETYISADDLRINLWNMEISDRSFNIVDIKPVNMEDLTEVITCAEFHPSQCNTLAYSSSKGSIRLIDMRQSALCDNHAKIFEEQEAPGTRSFFTEIIASISDIKFSRSGRYILSRDYMTLKLWDVNMESSPVVSFKVHEYLRPKLCDLYENDSIFDKFECCLSGDGLRVATGSYSNLFRVFGVTPGSEEATTLESSKTPNRRLMEAPSSKFSRFPALARTKKRGGAENGSPGCEVNGGTYDYSSKLLHLAWHPCENLIACAASNSLYMYYA